jgi:uncharacterized protein YjbI with pentapeptide repeats
VPSKPPTPPDPPDLPGKLDRARATRELDGLELAGALLEAADYSGQTARNCRFEEARLGSLDLGGVDLTACSFRDVAIAGGSWANIRTRSIRVHRAEFKSVRMTGADLAAAEIEDVSFVDCRIDLAFFVSARLRRVRFDRCRLDETDFTDANLVSVAFDGCSLARTVWTDAELSGCEMRACTISGAARLDRLRGVRMPVADVLAAATDLAGALGIEIVE